MPQLGSFLFSQKLINLFIATIIFITVIAYGDPVTSEQNINPGDPLYLTPLIKNGKTFQAVDASLVKGISALVSYSGFITVNSTLNSNLFFWFFPAEINNDAPVILWSTGVHGLSCIFSIFNQNGPFVENYDEENYTSNPFSWHKKFNMIYIDNSVETGFSFTENEEGYVTSAEEAARDIYEFLTQFFQLFPQLQTNPFYNAGESYGSTYALHTAKYIHMKNKESPEVFINLVGLILGSPWIDPYRQVEYGDYLFNVGLLSESSRDHFREQEAEIRNLITHNRYMDAYESFRTILYFDTYDLTGFTALSNVYDDDNFIYSDMSEFITENSTRKAIHVGSLEFYFINPTQNDRMQPNMMRSSKPEMETLLEAGYKLLLYVGNMDGTTGHLGIRALIKSLSWNGAKELLNGTRTIWREDGIAVGYNMTNSNMTFLIVRNAGHWSLAEQPEWIFRAVENFVY